MFDYLQKFNNLPSNLRDQVSSPSALARLAELEAKYKIELAIVVMKIMVKSLSFSDLPIYLSGELSLTPEAANQLVNDLKEKIFAPLTDYLGLSLAKRALDLDKDIGIIIKEAGLILPSAVAVSRFKNILATYMRGVRSKIDTRNTLAKDVKIGGLNLSQTEINLVLKICDTRVLQGSIAVLATPIAPVSAPLTRLDKIISQENKLAASTDSEYNLKQALAKGKIKPLASSSLDTSHELAGSKAQLDLPSPVTLTSKISTSSKIPLAPTTPTPTALTPKISPAPLPPKAPAVTPLRSAGEVKTINPVTRPASHLESLRPSVPKIRPAAPSVSVSTAVARTLAGSQASASSSIHPQMHDIKPMPKIMGPIEELQFLDVVNFRRLASTPAEITSKILAKIKLLEKDGYDKMVAGVVAWRQSPVNRLYLRLGQEAIVKSQSLKEIIAARKIAVQDYLNMDEIEAIVGLNSKLVF